MAAKDYSAGNAMERKPISVIGSGIAEFMVTATELDESRGRNVSAVLRVIERSG